MPDERSDPEPTEWAQARQRVAARRAFSAHLVVYVVVNAALVAIWAITGAGYFWPVWSLLGWGIGLALHGWQVFFRRPITDADIEAELRRRRS
jgi:hypothetical protein